MGAKSQVCERREGKKKVRDDMVRDSQASGQSQ